MLRSLARERLVQLLQLRALITRDGGLRLVGGRIGHNAVLAHHELLLHVRRQVGQLAALR